MRYALALYALTLGCASNRYEFAQPHMGTTVRIVLYASSPEEAERLALYAFAEIVEADINLSSYKPDSEVSRFNRGVPSWSFSPGFHAVVRAASDVSRWTDGAFDITAEPLVALWSRGRVPDMWEILLAWEKVGWWKPGARIDLCGIAKGHACQRALAALGRRPALVEAGGDLAVGAPPPGAPGWRIEMPDGRTLVVSQCGVATSGDTERHFDVGGRRFSHIIDPRTGWAVEGVTSATVVAPDATIADAMATAVVVGGLDVARRVSGVEACLRRTTGEVLETRGFGALTMQDDGFVPLFNGRDLTGWIPVNVAPTTFTARDGMIVCTGAPSGVLRTEKVYENYVLEFEWRHVKEGGNAGLFVHSDALSAPGVPFPRSIEVQIMLADDPEGNWTRHGDVFSIHGATFEPARPHPKGWARCLPSEERVKGAGEWNHYRVECQGGEISLSVNGAVVSGGTKCNPRKGYICLESEGSEVHFRNLRIKERAGSKPEEERDAGFVSLYNGVDLTGWVRDAGHDGHWVAKNWVLDYDGKSKAKDPCLWTEMEYGDIELIVDWRFPRKPVEMERPVFGRDGKETGEKVKVQDAGDSGVYLRGDSKSQVNIWCWPAGSGEVWGYRTDPKMPDDVRAAVTPKSRADKPAGEWNRFRITMKGDRLSVVLNGTLVIENAQLPGVAAKGRIALQHHGDPVQFANIFLRELK